MNRQARQLLSTHTNGEFDSTARDEVQTRTWRRPISGKFVGIYCPKTGCLLNKARSQALVQQKFQTQVWRADTNNVLLDRRVKSLWGLLTATCHIAESALGLFSEGKRCVAQKLRNVQQNPEAIHTQWPSTHLLHCCTRDTGIARCCRDRPRSPLPRVRTRSLGSIPAACGNLLRDSSMNLRFERHIKTLPVWTRTFSLFLQWCFLPKVNIFGFEFGRHKFIKNKK